MAEKRINGRTFEVKPMLASKALVLQARIARLAGPAVARLGEILGGYTQDATEEAKTRSTVAGVEAFSTVFATTAPEDLAELVREVVELARVRRESGNYEPVDLDGDMTGHSGDIIPLVVFVLREQFGDFFSGLPALGPQSTPAQR